MFKSIDFKNEEVWNTITHGIGAVLAVIFTVVMSIDAVMNGSTLEILSALIFGMGLISLYLASTLYHAESRPRRKRFFKLLDHLCIYLLIAGTYTPVMLVGLKDSIWGWAMFISIWILVIIGFIFKLSPLRKNKRLSLMLYVFMGWLAIIAVKPLWNNLSIEALSYLGLGGLAYTLGVFFYANQRIKFNHLIWHLFVLAGSGFHFFSVFYYILP